MASGGVAIQKTSTEDSVEEQQRIAVRKMASSQDLLTRINEEFLTCQICFETYTYPKSLNCQHTFCKKCLQEYFTPNTSALQCPTCRCIQPMPNGGIQDLKDNFFISSMSDMLKTVKEISSDDKGNTSLLCDTCDEDCRNPAMSRCLDCTDFLCSDCSMWHRRTKLTRGHKIVSLQEFETGIHNEELKSRAKIYCTVHEGEAAKMYCKTCECPICHECIECGHMAHSRCSLKEEVSNQSLQIEKLLVYAQSKMDVMQDMMKSLNEITELKRKSCEETEAMITRTSSRLINMINRRKEELIDEVRSMQKSESKQIDADVDAVEMQINSLLSCSEFSKKVLEYGTPKEILGLKNQMTQMLKQLLETHPANKFHKENRTEPTEFTFDERDIKNIDDIFGKIGLVSKPFPDGIEKVLRSLDTFCLKCSPPPKPINEDIPLKESIEINLIQQLGKQGDGDGEFESTPNIAVNSVGEVITSDTDGCKIQIFDPLGRFKDAFKTEVKGKYLHPTGVAVLRNDDIVVCCEDQVFVWTYEGKLLQGIGKGYFTNCNSVVVDSKNRLIVTDMAQRIVVIFESDGKFVCKFDGSENGAAGKLVEPRYVTCDSKDNIIVTDAGNCSVKKFNKKGELLRMFGEEGSMEGQFQGPRGICTDEHDNIIVADCWSHRVDLFTPEGSFIRHLISGVEGLHFPWSVAMTSSGRMMLSEDYSWAVKIFSLPEYRGDSPPPDSEGEITSPVTLIRGLELMHGQFDMANINKLSRWLKSSTNEGANDHLWRSLRIPHSSPYGDREKPIKAASRSKSFTSDSAYSREHFSLPRPSRLSHKSTTESTSTFPLSPTSLTLDNTNGISLDE